MESKCIVTENLAKFSQVFQRLKSRDPGVPGMALLSGATGSGKTTALVWAANRYNAYYVRANATWSSPAMLRAMVAEMGASPCHGASKNFDIITARLVMTGRALLIDEADYLLKDQRMVEVMRDLHDTTTVPVVLCGMSGNDIAGIEKQIATLPKFRQLARRMTEWIEFGPISREDARALADANCAPHVEDDLLDLAYARCQGSIGLLTVALSQIEAAGRLEKSMGLAQWGDRQFHLTDQGGL